HTFKKISLSLFSLVALTSSSLSKALAVPECLADCKVGKQLDLPIYEWVDRSKKRMGTVVAVHGLTLYAADWDNLAKHLAANGYRVFALDMRGFGRWRTEGSKWNGNSKVELGQSHQDLLDLVTTLRQTHPGQTLICMGESMGSNMILSLLA